MLTIQDTDKMAYDDDIKKMKYIAGGVGTAALGYTVYQLAKGCSSEAEAATLSSHDPTENYHASVAQNDPSCTASVTGTDSNIPIGPIVGAGLILSLVGAQLYKTLTAKPAPQTSKK